jgi:glutamate decarboxylase
VQKGCYDVGKFFAKGIEKFGIFDIIYDSNPKEGIPAVTWKLKPKAKVHFDLYQLSDVLRERGWLLPAYSLPANCEETIVQRVLLRHGCSIDLMELLLVDMNRAISRLTENPPAKVDSKKNPNRGSFNHGR